MSKLEISYVEQVRIGADGVAEKIRVWLQFMGWEPHNVEGHKIAISDDPNRQMVTYRPYFEGLG